MRRIGLAVVLALSLLLAPLAAGAQQATKVPRIGVLIPSTPTATSHIVEAFKQGLLEHGYVEGRDSSWSSATVKAGTNKFPHLPPSWVRIKVDVILTATDPGVAAVKQQTQTIPIVMVNTTLIRSGLVSSRA